MDQIKPINLISVFITLIKQHIRVLDRHGQEAAHIIGKTEDLGQGPEEHPWLTCLSWMWSYPEHHKKKTYIIKKKNQRLQDSRLRVELSCCII